MALGTCAGKETPLLLQAAESQEQTRLPKCTQKNASMEQTLRSQQRRNAQFELFLSNNHLARAGKKGKL